VSQHTCIRVYPREDGHLYHKNEHGGTLFGTHKVIEHEDGTISVSPSIVGNGIHGYLEHGIWRDC